MKCLNVENINPNFVVMEYAVRGPLVIRAGEIEKELEKVSSAPSHFHCPLPLSLFALRSSCPALPIHMCQM